MQKEGRAISRPAGGEVSPAVQAVVQLLDPAQPDLQRLQLSVRAVLEANQVSAPGKRASLSPGPLTCQAEDRQGFHAHLQLASFWWDTLYDGPS